MTTATTNQTPASAGLLAVDVIHPERNYAPAMLAQRLTVPLEEWALGKPIGEHDLLKPEDRQNLGLLDLRAAGALQQALELRGRRLGGAISAIQWGVGRLHAALAMPFEVARGVPDDDDRKRLRALLAETGIGEMRFLREVTGLRGSLRDVRTFGDRQYQPATGRELLFTLVDAINGLPGTPGEELAVFLFGWDHRDLPEILADLPAEPAWRYRGDAILLWLTIAGKLDAVSPDARPVGLDRHTRRRLVRDLHRQAEWWRCVARLASAEELDDDAFNAADDLDPPIHEDLLDAYHEALQRVADPTASPAQVASIRKKYPELTAAADAL